MTVRLGALVVGAALLLGSAALAADEPKDEDCLACHADRDLKRDKPRPGRGVSVFVDPQSLKGSVHGALGCVGCHAKATAPHDTRLAAVDCAACHGDATVALSTGVHGGATGKTPRSAVACSACHGTHEVRKAAADSAMCSGCHSRQFTQYRESIHGRARQKGDREAATCTSCHGAPHAALAKTDPRSPTYHLNLPRTCAQCHGDSDLARRHNIQVGAVYQLYMDSIHGRAVTRSGLLVSANCSDCHGAHGIQPSADPSSRVFRKNIPATCGGCHAGVASDYLASIHGQTAGKNGSPAAVCTDCHSAHQIRRVEAAPAQLEVVRECGTCHRESLTTYRDTFHGKVTGLGYTRAAKCADCHGSHTIQPASNPMSKVSSTNIVSTCRQCHPGATWRFAQFHPHANPEDSTRFPLLHFTSVFMTGLLVGTLSFFGLHTVLWFPRSLIERLRGHRGGESGPR